MDVLYENTKMKKRKLVKRNLTGKEIEERVNKKLRWIVDHMTSKELMSCIFPVLIEIEVEKRIKKIRNISLKSYRYKVSEKTCLLCPNKAQTTHHINYDPEVTTSLCNKCHWKHGQEKLDWWLNKIWWHSIKETN